MSKELVGEDKADFERLEGVIREGLETFYEVGKALMEIKERGLYKAVSSTFEAYVQIRWKMSRRHADQQIEAAATVLMLDRVSTGAIAPLPETEGVARPLTTLPSEKQPEAWTEAVEESGGKPTAKDVQRAVDKRRDLPKVPRPPKMEKPEDTAAAIVSSSVRVPEPLTPLAPKRRPNIAHLMNVIDAATGLSAAVSDEEIAAVPYNDLMGQRLLAAREFIDRVLAHHSNKEKSA